MDVIERLSQYLQERTPYPCLPLLEAALASRKHWHAGEIPTELMQDLRHAQGDGVVQNEVARLLELGVLAETGPAEARRVKLPAQHYPAVEQFLQQLRCHLALEADGSCMEAYEFLNQLNEYLLSAGAEISLQESGTGTCLLALAGETYRLLLTFSPFWLPLAAGQRQEEENYIIAFGPFASQSWETMYPYCDMEEFRDRVAMYDPWSREKVSLCKGRLPVYIDWFFRDRYQSRFSIPADFCEALHSMGLMRYNDER